MNNSYDLGFPAGSDNKEPTCNSGDQGPGRFPWAKKIPLEKRTTTHSSILA